MVEVDFRGGEEKARVFRKGLAVELFRNTNIDFLGKKWYFLALSLIFSVAGLSSMLFWHHVPLGIDFRGGTVVDVKFTQLPNVDSIRTELDRAGLKNATIQALTGSADGTPGRQTMVSLPRSGEPF